jgi:hypothetical protein
MIENESNVDKNFNYYIKNDAFSLDPFSKAGSKDSSGICVHDWKKSNFVTELAQPQNFNVSLFDLKSDPIFGGESVKIESLNQLNRIDWKTIGKQRIDEILQGRKIRNPVSVDIDQNVYD